MSLRVCPVSSAIHESSGERRQVKTFLGTFVCLAVHYLNLLFTANIPVITDAGLKCVVSRGIEMKGLKFANIPLKNVMRDVKMEKYEFVPFTEAGAIEDVDARELQSYIYSCNLVADRLAALLQKGDSAKGASISAILHRPHADNEVLLKLLAEMYKSVVDENGNPTGQNISSDLVRKIVAENKLDFSKDLLNLVTKNGRIMRSSLGMISRYHNRLSTNSYLRLFVDVVNENCLRNMNVIEANYSTGSIVKDLLQHMGYFFHYPLVVDCVLATKDTKALPKEVQNAGYQLLDWDTVSSSTLPTIEAPADLLVYKDSPELAKMNLKTFAKDLAGNVKEGGFLFAVFRSKLCKAESLLNHITGQYFSKKLIMNLLTHLLIHQDHLSRRRHWFSVSPTLRAAQ